jgi:hypothetical protein
MENGHTSVLTAMLRRCSRHCAPKSDWRRLLIVGRGVRKRTESSVSTDMQTRGHDISLFSHCHPHLTFRRALVHTRHAQGSKTTSTLLCACVRQEQL